MKNDLKIQRRDFFTRISDGLTHIVVLKERQNERRMGNKNQMTIQPTSNTNTDDRYVTIVTWPMNIADRFDVFFLL